MISYEAFNDFAYDWKFRTVEEQEIASCLPESIADGLTGV